MNKFHNNLVIAELGRGEVITGRLMTRIARSINANTRHLSGPRQQGALDDTEDENTQSEDYNFTETSRTNATVTITDSNGDTHDIDQLDQVILVNGRGQVMTLNFDNP